MARGGDAVGHDPEEDERHAEPYREVVTGAWFRWRRTGECAKPEREAGHDEPEAHHREPRSYPCEKRPLSSEANPRIDRSAATGSPVHVTSARGEGSSKALSGSPVS